MSDLIELLKIALAVVVVFGCLAMVFALICFFIGSMAGALAAGFSIVFDYVTRGLS